MRADAAIRLADSDSAGTDVSHARGRGSKLRPLRGAPAPRGRASRSRNHQLGQKPPLRPHADPAAPPERAATTCRANEHQIRLPDCRPTDQKPEAGNRRPKARSRKPRVGEPRPTPEPRPSRAGPEAEPGWAGLGRAGPGAGPGWAGGRAGLGRGLGWAGGWAGPGTAWGGSRLSGVGARINLPPPASTIIQRRSPPAFGAAGANGSCGVELR